MVTLSIHFTPAARKRFAILTQAVKDAVDSALQNELDNVPYVPRTMTGDTVKVKTPNRFLLPMRQLDDGTWVIDTTGA